MYEYVFNNKLVEFNNAIAATGNRRLSSIRQLEDFSELKEVKFIELMKSAGIITADVRKILDEKLGIRNSAGHPSKVHLKESKAIEFGHDLLDNVILKF
jgi:hypothetical protein